MMDAYGVNIQIGVSIGCPTSSSPTVHIETSSPIVQMHQQPQQYQRPHQQHRQQQFDRPYSPSTAETERQFARLRLSDSEVPHREASTIRSANPARIPRCEGEEFWREDGEAAREEDASDAESDASSDFEDGPRMRLPPCGQTRLLPKQPINAVSTDAAGAKCMKCFDSDLAEFVLESGNFPNGDNTKYIQFLGNVVRPADFRVDAKEFKRPQQQQQQQQQPQPQQQQQQKEKKRRGRPPKPKSEQAVRQHKGRGRQKRGLLLPPGAKFVEVPELLAAKTALKRYSVSELSTPDSNGDWMMQKFAREGNLAKVIALAMQLITSESLAALQELGINSPNSSGRTALMYFVNRQQVNGVKFCCMLANQTNLFRALAEAVLQPSNEIFNILLLKLCETRDDNGRAAVARNGKWLNSRLIGWRFLSPALIGCDGMTLLQVLASRAPPLLLGRIQDLLELGGGPAERWRGCDSFELAASQSSCPERAILLLADGMANRIPRAAQLQQRLLERGFPPSPSLLPCNSEADWDENSELFLRDLFDTDNLYEME